MKLEANAKPKQINVIIGTRQSGKTTKLLKPLFKNLATFIDDFYNTSGSSVEELTPRFLVLLPNVLFKEPLIAKLRRVFSIEAFKVIEKVLVVDIHQNNPELLKDKVRQTAATKTLQLVCIDDWPVEHTIFLREVNEISPSAFFNVVAWCGTTE